MMDNIKVSVYCLTYNHEYYIKDALEGFISQKCDFNFEVIVHDDASSDKTQEIIKEYANKYPNIIKPILQDQNQRSKGINIVQTYIIQKLRGEYVAMCEGDDYWIDENKLQMQVDYMEKHKDCSFCFTNGYIDDQSEKYKRRVFIPYSDEDRTFYIDADRDYSLSNFYELSFVPTASFLYRKKDFEYIQNLYKRPCPAGDLKTRLLLTALGYAHYFNTLTCVYRENVPNSAMSRWQKEKRKQRYLRALNIYEMIKYVNEFTKFEYADGLSKIMSIHANGVINNAQDFSFMKDSFCKSLFSEYTTIKKIEVVAKVIIPDKIIDRMLQRKKNI